MVGGWCCEESKTNTSQPQYGEAHSRRDMRVTERAHRSDIVSVLALSLFPRASRKVDESNTSFRRIFVSRGGCQSKQKSHT